VLYMCEFGMCMCVLCICEFGTCVLSMSLVCVCVCVCMCNMQCLGAGKMTQLLAALAALAEKLCLVPHGGVQLSVTPFPEDLQRPESSALFWPPQALHTHGALTYVQTKCPYKCKI